MVKKRKRKRKKRKNEKAKVLLSQIMIRNRFVKSINTSLVLNYKLTYEKNLIYFDGLLRRKS